jgi:hypothetical protein
MRARIFQSALAVVALTFGCEREGPGPKVTPPPGSGTVEAGQPFRLVWPNDERPQACIEIPADAVPAGTEVSISVNVNSNNPSEWPAAFRDWHEQAPGRTVYMPLIEFSADSEFTITNPDSFFTVGICARYRRGEDDPDPELLEDDPTTEPGPSGQVAHPSGGTLEFLTPAPTPCPCHRTGPNSGRQNALSRAGALLAGTPLLPDRLEASVVAEEGLGGKGGSFSPFGVVRP